MTKIVILGAGLTGLSAAYHLEQSGHFDYQIFEKNDRAGGLLRSFQQDGFTFDFTGHLLHISDDYFKNFLNTITSLDQLSLTTRKSAIYSHNITSEYPFQSNLYGLPLEVIYECIDGFINRKTSIRKPLSFYDWVLKYFGAGIGKHFFFPYNSKLLAYDVKKIHPSWTGRFVPQTSLKAILQGSLQKPSDQNVGYNSQFYYPKEGGIEFIIKKIVAQLKNAISPHRTASHINIKTKTVHFNNGEQEKFDHLISTMPLNKLLTCIEPSSSVPFETIAPKLHCNSVINFNIGFSQENLSDKHWLYFPEKKYPFYRLGFWNNINPTSVKPGCSAIYGESSYQPSKASPKQINTLAEQSVQQALQYLQVKEADIVTQKTLHLEHAYVVYDQWREKNLSPLLKQLTDYGIYSVGRFGAWKYSSMQEAVLDGKQVATEILTSINKTEEPKNIPATMIRDNTKKPFTIV